MQAERRLTVADEIGLAHFGDPYTGEAEAIQFSPDGKFFAVHTERGRLDTNRLEDELRFYRIGDVREFLMHPRGAAPPPTWSVVRSTGSRGPVVSQWRWLENSSGVAFLEPGVNEARRLVLADLTRRTLEPLTPADVAVTAFDIRDRNHFVYAVADPRLSQAMAAERSAPSLVGTGRSLLDLLFTNERSSPVPWVDRSLLWALVGGEPFQVRDESGSPVVLFFEGRRNVALSPDGGMLATVLPVPDVLASWERLYPPLLPGSPYRVRAGRQNLAAPSGRLVSRYVHIDLRRGAIRPLVDAPTSAAAGWWADGTPDWSADGSALVLPGTFVPSGHGEPSRPCVAYVSLAQRTAACIELLKGRTKQGVEEGYRRISNVQFAGKDNHVVRVEYLQQDGAQGGSRYYRQATDGRWSEIGQDAADDQRAAQNLVVRVKQGLNDPPVLIATDRRTSISRVIFDPNPQLKDYVLGEASVYRWTDEAGRTWVGGLYKPPGFREGQAYPLVIQTHGFRETEFRPDGIFPTAFAARALAAAGIVVLQVGDCPIRTTTEEGACNVAGYEAAVRRLAADGVIAPDRVGLIGFSRTCYYVMEMLTTSSLPIKAASITDGVMAGYLQYMMTVDLSANAHANEYDAMVGARPFGEGLAKWLERAPVFNMDKVSAPLMVVGQGPASLLFMWEPYAALRYLKKPVDLIMLSSNEHVLTNPAARMVSQGGSVDWFRFWLKGEEDGDPAKSEQYARWRQMREPRDGSWRSPR